MGSVCSCFTVRDVDVGGNAASNDQNHTLCKCFSCCFQNLINKCGTIFGQAQGTAGTSVNQGPPSSTAPNAINSSCNTIRSQDRRLPNSAAPPRRLQIQEDVAFRRQEKGISHSRVEPEPDVDAYIETTQKLLKAGNLLKSDSAHQGSSSSTAGVTINSSRNTIMSRDRGLPNTAAPRQPQIQQDVAFKQQDKRTSHSRVEPEPADVEITVGADTLLKSNCDGGSKECRPEMMVTAVQHDVCSSEDEDVCPTCLEEYTPENPKILTKCSHHYHLSCIYEWQERSETCPVCGKLMEFEESN
ncbi:E3 ubiquitin-protein ligase Praja-1-like [Solanum pennellii]|uniref:RING-type E3 ubiquitin transferase n=1 Tax=Solanum pennellii TaxID=28526 RepID=A0ABM1GRP1_SOLPN|nr:E3 ubiquitin-protein ligase Praja-1-like [Solanum pennellii]XP_015074915.1 E3 ubiquitin-protein ligase Praja-1-like [Solanum pennellii]